MRKRQRDVSVQIASDVPPELLDKYKRVKAELAAKKAKQQKRWYCDVEDCDGEPHEGFHWCKHPIDSDEHTWECRHARGEQCPPHDFASHVARIWLYMGGRGTGKTRAGAEWIADGAKNAPGSEWAVIAPTKDDVRETCFEGKSGLLRAFDIHRDDPRYNKTALLLRLDNGTLIKSYSAEEPARVHGPNLSGAWCDEIAKWKRAQEMWDSLVFAIRDGDAQTMITTTPKGSKLVREFTAREDGSVAVTRGTTFGNEQNLADAFIAEMKVRYSGTRLEKQELYGEMLEDVPGALWTLEMIETTRAKLID